MSKGQKRKKTNALQIEASLCLVRNVSPGSSRADSSSNNDSVERLAEIMSNLL